jgi:hypothetical protein
MRSSVLRLRSDSLRSSSEAATTTTKVRPRACAGLASSLAWPVMLRTCGRVRMKEACDARAASAGLSCG